ncbi:hypothetical protein [uncultured Sphingorhabdus sp.]|uniref:hypothetical protein n=1 Tax=uncultured Sphingorhabdus sp. TaxID=1686106 RepID=UPI0026022A69|nr:hypothetical protein [uncultured Sphingorhabdus sp.]HMS19266.1 hypothetical protein [Sphingorhabdus sp.]
MIAARLLAIILLCVSSLSLAACRSHSSSDFKSPDGTKTMRLEIADPGAAGTARARVYLVQDAGNESEEEHLVFFGDGWPFDVRWIDENEAIISACDARKYEHIRIVYGANGSADTRIRLVFEPTVIDQTYYCG